MTRKRLYLLVVVCILLVTMVPANVVAQRPEPPDPLAQSDGLPAIDMQNLPEALQKAATLQESLTPEQHAAVREILDRYQPEMQAINDALMATGKAPAGAELQPFDRDIVARMAALVDDVEAEMAAVLDADQLALYQAAMQPAALSGDEAISELPGAAMPKPDGSPAEAQGYTTNCFYGPQYDARVKFYAAWGYTYAYYNYYYYGTTYAYYAYYYAYYARGSSWNALLYSADTYFFLYYMSSYQIEDSYPFPYWAYYWGTRTRSYENYAYQYAYLDYQNTSHTYAYYAYYYLYYAYYYAYYGYYYNYYCYYYL
jgi:hypothetical protein